MGGWVSVKTLRASNGIYLNKSSFFKHTLRNQIVFSGSLFISMLEMAVWGEKRAGASEVSLSHNEKPADKKERKERERKVQPWFLSYVKGGGENLSFETFTYNNRQRFCCFRFHSKLSDLNLHAARCSLSCFLVWIIEWVSVSCIGVLKNILTICRVAMPKCNWFFWAWRRYHWGLIGRRCWHCGAGDVFGWRIRNWYFHFLFVLLRSVSLLSLERRHRCDARLILPQATV